MKIIIKKKTPKWHKPAKIIAVLLLLVFAYWQLKPNVEVTPQEVVITPFIPEEVERDGAIIDVNDIQTINGQFRFVDDQTFIFKGTHAKKGEALYEVDLQNLTLRGDVDGDEPITTTELTIQNQSPENVTLLYYNDLYSMYYIADDALRGLYKIDSEGNVYQISKRMAVSENDQPYTIVSDNGTKLVYFETGTNRIVTYDFITNKKKIIQRSLTLDQLNHLQDYIVISPLGGYVLFEDDEKLIYVYGADSAKAYVDGFMGINPTFSENDGYLYYFYEGAMSGDFAGRQFGIVDLSNGNIQYDTAEDDEQYHISITTIPDSDAVLYINGIVDDMTFIIDSIEVYDPSTKEKVTAVSMAGTHIKINSPVIVRDHLMLLSTPEGDTLFYHLEDQNLTTLTGLQPFDTSMAVQQYYLPYEKGFIIAYGNAVYRYDHLGTMKLMDFEGTLSKIVLSPDYMTIAAYIEGNKIVFSDKISEVY
ncbi:hypothetical protein KHM83_08895 [Fusibacter paucivorans]|uniref:Uncharacterized protein n=1 Tax=Fusibacter paucivorans TaxID=76009 RepID=A0ABS5PNN9_9FIRM|nr:hypothetical protein [Fusibacter paucivorans]MBS7526793.1 hypothetical protein [Fusibacter paucivorans]